MRRSDLHGESRKPPAWSAALRAAPIADAVHRDFVDMLFNMRLPVAGLGLVFALVAGLIAKAWGDTVLTVVAALGALVTIGRYALMTAYFGARPVPDRARLEAWERRYALGSYAFALLLALFTVRILERHEPLVALLAISLVFSFDAGIVARISVRPVICCTSLLIATLPVVAALAAHAFTHAGYALHSALFAIEALLMTMIAALSLQTVRHLYLSAVEHHTSRHDLAKIARFDALTGLANRLTLRERFQADLAGAASTAGLALHYIDLDGFKAVNDGFGHPAGDAVLQQVAQRMMKIIRAEDTIARLGGDEFVILQPAVADPSEAELLGRRIVKRLSEPYLWNGNELTLSASIGIALGGDRSADLEALLARADTALYRSKAAGKRTVTFYDPAFTINPASDARFQANGKRA